MSDNERFYIEQASGPRGRYWDHEYAVVDRLTGKAVALFMVTRSPGQSWQAMAALKREAHSRARKHCRELLRAVPAPHGVATVGSEAGEGLELDDLAAVRGRNHLSVADVHDDVAASA